MMDTWQQYTLRANTEYQLACYGNAILMHNQALDHARHEFAATARCCVDDALARVLISNFNLADCYRALGEITRAADCYLAAQQFLVSTSAQLNVSEQSLQSLQHANSHLHVLWCGFVKKHRDDISYSSQLAYQEGSSRLLDAAAHTAVLH